MFKHVRATGVLAGAAAVMLTASPSLATIDKCSKLIDGENLKIQSTFAKAFGKCNDFYRKEVAKGAKKGVPADLAKAGASCQKQLDKAFVKFDKETSKLASKVDGKTCIDADLLALGHLPTKTFGTRWAQTQGVGALQSAYEQQVQGTKDWVNMLKDMADAGSCPTCDKLRTPPCSDLTCALVTGTSAPSGSFASVDLQGAPTIVVPLAGFNNAKVCDVSSLISSAAGVLYVVSGPSKSLAPAPVGAIATSCTTVIGAEGLIQCGSSPQKISYQSCTDHDTGGVTNVAGATSSGACSGDACAASMADREDSGVTNGGNCITLTSGSGSAGDAFINLTSRISIHDPGSDCLDDPNATDSGLATTTPLTTGSAQATVKNADGSTNSINSTQTTGSPYDCATLKRGDGGTVTLVGAFPALNGLQPAPGSPLIDDVVGFQLQCQAQPQLQ
jgi:hypothetical protein